MKFELIAQMINGAREELSQPEFGGDGLDETLAEAIEAARDAFEYLNAEALRVEHIDIYCAENGGCSNGYCGYFDDCGWHRDCDCTIG